MLGGTWVGSPDLGSGVIDLGYTSIKGEGLTRDTCIGENDGSGPGGDVPSTDISVIAASKEKLSAVCGTILGCSRETQVVGTASTDFHPIVALLDWGSQSGEDR